MRLVINHRNIIHTTNKSKRALEREELHKQLIRFSTARGTFGAEITFMGNDGKHKLFKSDPTALDQIVYPGHNINGTMWYEILH
jgi:hypothetical protein